MISLPEHNEGCQMYEFHLQNRITPNGEREYRASCAGCGAMKLLSESEAKEWNRFKTVPVNLR
jgi:hypothetical protein